MNIRKLLARPKVFNRVFDISPQLFIQLSQELKPKWQEAAQRRKKGEGRERAEGGGRKLVLSFEEALAMHLLYIRAYAPYVFIGTIFRIDDATVTRYFQRLRPIVASKMKKIIIEQIPISQEEILDLIADATEQETERRKGSGYSGKKKRQTVKTQIVVDVQGRIKHISQSMPGNMHDKKLYDQTGVKADLGDLGYLGTNMRLPFKSSKLCKLTKKQKKYNLAHSRRRIVVEHVFAHLKQFKILANRFRNNLAYYNDIFMTVAGLYNMRRV